MAFWQITDHLTRRSPQSTHHPVTFWAASFEKVPSAGSKHGKYAATWHCLSVLPRAEPYEASVERLHWLQPCTPKVPDNALASSQPSFHRGGSHTWGLHGQDSARQSRSHTSDTATAGTSPATGASQLDIHSRATNANDIHSRATNANDVHTRASNTNADASQLPSTTASNWSGGRGGRLPRARGRVGPGAGPASSAMCRQGEEGGGEDPTVPSSPEGPTLLLSGGGDGGIRVWHVSAQGGRLLCTLPGAQGRLEQVRAGPSSAFVGGTGV